jgi:hypothetical protein
MPDPVTLPNGRVITPDAHGFIRDVVPIPLEDIVGLDLEGFLDLASERLTGTCMLADISYCTAGLDVDGTLLIEVSGGANDIIADLERRPALTF